MFGYWTPTTGELTNRIWRPPKFPNPLNKLFISLLPWFGYWLPPIILENILPILGNPGIKGGIGSCWGGTCAPVCVGWFWGWVLEGYVGLFEGCWGCWAFIYCWADWVGWVGCCSLAIRWIVSPDSLTEYVSKYHNHWVWQYLQVAFLQIQVFVYQQEHSF